MPYDLVCPPTGTCANSGPSFFSTVRLTSVATQQYNGSGYSTVDSWKLTQTIPTTGTYNTSTLWLSSITHTGWSSSTRPPTSTITATTSPCIGLRTLPDPVRAAEDPAPCRFRGGPVGGTVYQRPPTRTSAGGYAGRAEWK